MKLKFAEDSGEPLYAYQRITLKNEVNHSALHV